MKGNSDIDLGASPGHLAFIQSLGLRQGFAGRDCRVIVIMGKRTLQNQSLGKSSTKFQQTSLTLGKPASRQTSSLVGGIPAFWQVNPSDLIRDPAGRKENKGFGDTL